MRSLISDLVGPHYDGKPILVIGGGPTAKADLKKIPLDYPGCVISANGHGFKQDRFKVDFTVSVDFRFGSGVLPMQEYLSQFDVPHINRWSWADHRLPEFNFNGDSGLTAIVVAVILGGHPIIPLGIDRYVGEKRYFWEDGPDESWLRRKVHFNVNGRMHMQKCIDYCEPHEVRPMSGTTLEYWPNWIGATPLRPWVATAAPQRTLKGQHYSLLEPIFLHSSDRVDTGPITLTDQEARGFLNTRKIVPLTAI